MTLSSMGSAKPNFVARQLLPAGALAANAPRWAVASVTHQTPTSGRLAMYLVYLEAGTVVSNITFMSGTTAGATLTHTWFSLYSSALAKLAVTADDTSAAWAAVTAKTLALTAPYTVPTSGNYYLGVTCVGTTMPTFTGSSGVALAAGTLAPILSGWSTTGLTDPASAPSTAAALAAISGWAWCYVS